MPVWHPRGVMKGVEIPLEVLQSTFVVLYDTITGVKQHPWGAQ